MPYWQLFYHIVWATKNRAPLITADNEPMIYGFLRAKAIGVGATLFALNGMADHVHIVAAIPPSVAVAKFIGQVKAVASTKFNKSGMSQQPLVWQEEYGVFSFDGKRLPNYVNYVDRQKAHHAQRAVIPVLERLSGAEVLMIRDTPLLYEVDVVGWRREMEAWDMGMGGDDGVRGDHGTCGDDNGRR